MHRQQKMNAQCIVNMPESLDMGFTAITSTNSQLFYIENPTDQAVKFSFEFQKFKVTPDRGQIGANQKVQFSVNFTPECAEVVVATIILNLENEQSRIFKISGIGKYPFLQLNTNKLNFEPALIGKAQTKEVTIKNSSEVTANFTVHKIIDDDFKDNTFILDYWSGTIPPKSTFLIKVTYQPQITGVVSVMRFKADCQGGNNLFFECSGCATPYRVLLSEESINFGEIKIGNTATRLLTVHNESELPTSYQFFTDRGNTFSFSRTRGIVPAKSTERIIINFTPRHTICYYERVFMVSRNHLIVPLDLLGTCYDLLIKPIPLLQQHVNNFRRRVIQGKLTEVDFKYMENSYIIKMNQMIGLGTSIQSLHNIMTVNVQFIQYFVKIDLDNPQQPNSPLANSQLIGNMQGEWQEEPNQTILHKELMLDPKSEFRMIQFGENFLDFGFCDAMQQSSPRELEIFNKMNCKLTIFWSIQSHATMDEQSKLPVFIIYPETSSVKANSSVKFQVTFRPTKNCYYYYQHIQFFAIKYNPKLTKKLIEEAQRVQGRNTQIGNLALNDTLKNTQSLKNPLNSTALKRNNLSLAATKQQEALEQMTADEMIPTFSASLPCVGHAFNINSQPYIPIVDFAPNSRVLFAPCSLSESVYQTVELHNKSDTPVYFKFSPDTNRVFRVFPQQGLILGKSFCLLLIEFVPKENRGYQQTLSCYLNHQMSNQIQLQCQGYCSSPSLELDNNGQVFFPPSFTGVFSRQKVKLHNQSRVNLEYEVVIPEKYSTELYLEPPMGNIKPNETIFLDCSFIPYKKKEYHVKVLLIVKEVLDPSQNLVGFHLPGSGNPSDPLKQRQPIAINYQLEVFGAGGDGSLNIEPSNIDFGIVKVNFNKKVYATLHNHSNCTFYVELGLRLANDGETLGTHDTRLQSIIHKSFTLDLTSSIIAANSKLDIGIMFNPHDVNEFDLILDVIATEKNPKLPRGPNAPAYRKITSQKCKLVVRGKGSYPLLKIVDVRNDSISVATLWENFQINGINQELSKDLNEDEQKFLKIEQLNFTEATQLQKRLRAYDWNFGYLPSKPSVKSRKIVITVQNVGGTELEWQFKLPSDHQIELEPWADPGEPSEEETFEKAILERKIFQIKPKSGIIPPGGFKDLELIYTPSNLDDEPGYNKKNKLNEQHFLRVVLQILNGKPLVINLKGTTLAPLEGLLAVKKNSFTLPNTPVGLLQPVKYPIEVQNVGSSKVSYKTIVQELDESGNPVDSQFNVFDIQNPQESLLPNEKQYLYCLFKPLEQKAYFFELFIEVSDMVKVIQEVKLQIWGSGYAYQPIRNKGAQVAEIPRQRSFVSPIGSKVFFSIEEIDFGELLPLKSAHRMIILYNLSTVKRFTYDFGLSYFALSNNKPGLCCGDELLIETINGELEPGSFTEIKLTMTAGRSPSVYEGEIECQIVWDQKISQQQQNQSQLSSNSSGIIYDKETLFLRIKKRSNLNVELVNSFRAPPPPIHNPMAHPFQQLLGQIISEILTDSKTEQILKRIDHQPICLFGSLDSQDNQEQKQKQKLTQQRDYKDYRTLFLEDEFLELADLIMENTFFNIVQETTRKECDLLRISKTFVTPANKR